MGRSEASQSALLAPLLLDADISRAFFLGQGRRDKVQRVEKKRPKVTVFIEYSQHPQCVKPCARVFTLIITWNSSNNSKRVII